MSTAIFARSAPTIVGSPTGYSTLIVRCESPEQLQAVRHLLSIKEFNGLKRTKGAWRYDQGFLGIVFGGKFDFIFATREEMAMPRIRYQVISDDRYIGAFEGREIMEELADATE